MQFVWLAIIAVSLSPVAVVSLQLNPLVFLVLGPEAWREQAARLQPFRWWIGASMLVCALATAVYGVRYG